MGCITLLTKLMYCSELMQYVINLQLSVVWIVMWKKKKSAINVEDPQIHLVTLREPWSYLHLDLLLSLYGSRPSALVSKNNSTDFIPFNFSF